MDTARWERIRRLFEQARELDRVFLKSIELRGIVYRDGHPNRAFPRVADADRTRTVRRQLAELYEAQGRPDRAAAYRTSEG